MSEFVQRHRTLAELEAGLPAVERSPREVGVLRLIVRRPTRGAREIVAQAELDTELGLSGDRWALGKRRREDQLTLMNARVAALLADSEAGWALAGDQLYVDLDLGSEHVPPGTRLAIGTAVIVISAEPHRGCRLFAERYGADALKLVNSSSGERLKLRGVNAWVAQSGAIRSGDAVRVLFE